MRIGLVGGTGREGSGLAMRWARAGHAVRIGSRDAARGESKAVELAKVAGAELLGGDNTFACDGAEVVVLCVPYTAHDATLRGLAADLAGKIVVDITVPLKPPKVRRVHLPEGKAAALEAKAILGDSVRLVAALHHVSSAHLGDLEHDIPCDGLVCSDDRQARGVVVSLLTDLGMRGLEAGPLDNAIALEALTPVLLFMNKKYASSGTGIHISGIPEASE